MVWSWQEAQIWAYLQAAHVCGTLSADITLTAVIGISCLDAFTRFRAFTFAGFVLGYSICLLSSFYLSLVCVLSTFGNEVALKCNCLV
jgi:hypothetical protein